MVIEDAFALLIVGSIGLLAGGMGSIDLHAVRNRATIIGKNLQLFITKFGKRNPRPFKFFIKF